MNKDINADRIHENVDRIHEEIVVEDISNQIEAVETAQVFADANSRLGRLALAYLDALRVIERIRLAAGVLGHKWLDPVCVSEGCQSRQLLWQPIDDSCRDGKVHLVGHTYGWIALAFWNGTNWMHSRDGIFIGYTPNQYIRVPPILGKFA